MEQKLITALEKISKIYHISFFDMECVMKNIKIVGQTTFRDIRYFSEIGLPLYGLMEKHFFMINKNPAPFSLLNRWRCSGKPICVKGCISYNDLCRILIKEFN